MWTQRRRCALVTTRDVVITAVAALEIIDTIRSLKPSKPPPIRPFLPPLPPVDWSSATARKVPPAPTPDNGWLYELCTYSNETRRVRPATPAEQEATDATRHVDGTGIFACLPDGSLLRSDDEAYPPAPQALAQCRWVAP